MLVAGGEETILEFIEREIASGTDRPLAA